MKPSLPARTIALFLLASAAQAGEPLSSIQGTLDHFCFNCHDDEKSKGDVNLARVQDDAAFWKNPKLWEKVLQQLGDRTMPPKRKGQPTDEQRAELTAFIKGRLDKPDLAHLPDDPGPAVLRRLSRLEYNLTIRDLLGVDTKPADSFPPDGGGGGGFDNNAGTLFVPPLLMERYVATAGEVLEQAKPERLLTVRAGGAVDERGAARRNFERFAPRAFRRPVQTAEVDRLLALYDAARARGDGWESAVRLGLQATLASPYFLFRVEEERSGTAAATRVSEHELASRLSYFIWSSMPDEELSRAAAAGKLSDPATLDKQVARMLADPKARDFAENFAGQWLRTRELLHAVEPAPDKFPQWTPALRDAFYQEPVEFFHGILRDNRPLTDFLDADYTYANETLARFYGVEGVAGSEVRRVPLADRRRGGVLGMGGVLTLTSYPRRTSPVLRGVWVLDEILGTPAPPPPANVNVEKVERGDKNLTFRQQLEQHRENASCAGCHARMDPLGFGLENFDAIGAWRTDVQGKAVDSTGELASGERFSGPAEMKKLLLERKDQFTRTLTEKMLSYALGRGVEPTDWITVHRISRAVAEDGYSMRRLVLEVARSHPFQYRRGKI